jgi:hypothetical protein
VRLSIIDMPQYDFEGSLTIHTCPNAGNVKPVATMMPRPNCFMIFLRTGAMRGRKARVKQRPILLGSGPPWAPQAAFQFTGYRQRPMAAR